ncbi:MAG: NAD(P)H-dependent oxidoreductase subunit E, partial [Longimicrobiales bacterium]|nr:NAD(P)H-dependent oxidoreductase subunit E [Longimicrobiales bacterium]
LEHTDTEAGQISGDGEFTVIEAECLGACGFPTVVQINNRYFENVNPEDVPDLLDRLRTTGVDPAGNGAGGPAGNGAGGDASPTTNTNTTTNTKPQAGHGEEG